MVIYDTCTYGNVAQRPGDQAVPVFGFQLSEHVINGASNGVLQTTFLDRAEGRPL